MFYYACSVTYLPLYPFLNPPYFFFFLMPFKDADSSALLPKHSGMHIMSWSSLLAQCFFLFEHIIKRTHPESNHSTRFDKCTHPHNFKPYEDTEHPITLESPPLLSLPNLPVPQTTPILNFFHHRLVLLVLEL